VTRTLPPPGTQTAPPPQLEPGPEPQLRGTRNPLEEEMSSGAPPPAPYAAAAEPPPGAAAVRPLRPGSVVYQSLPEADVAAAYVPPAASARGSLPSADEMSARGVVPPLRLELHVWSSQPQERFVFVNGRRYREGEATAEGATIEEITRDGVIMNSGGNRFLLGRN
jgi:general secretion pathway protein B